MAKDTIAAHMDKLTYEDKKILMWVLRMHGKVPDDFHIGKLPFVRIVQVEAAYHNRRAIMTASEIAGDRRIAGIIAKLLRQPVSDLGKYATWQRPLYSPAVIQALKGCKELTLRMAPKTTATAGMAWNLAKRDYAPATKDMLTMVVLVLKKKVKHPHKYDLWQVTCPKTAVAYVDNWLTDNCMT